MPNQFHLSISAPYYEQTPIENIFLVQGKFNKLEAIHDKKKNTNFNEYLAGFPKEFAIFVDYCRNLPFKATPDYMFLRYFITTNHKIMILETSSAAWDKNGTFNMI